MKPQAHKGADPFAMVTMACLRSCERATSRDRDAVYKCPVTNKITRGPSRSYNSNRYAAPALYHWHAQSPAKRVAGKTSNQRVQMVHVGPASVLVSIFHVHIPIRDLYSRLVSHKSRTHVVRRSPRIWIRARDRRCRRRRQQHFRHAQQDAKTRAFVLRFTREACGSLVFASAVRWHVGLPGRLRFERK